LTSLMTSAVADAVDRENSNEQPRTSGFVTGSVYRTLPRAPETWVVEHVVPIGGLLNLYGAPKLGKSFAALQLAIAVASEQPEWLGFQVALWGPVCYLQLDTPRTLWADRIDQLEAGGIDVSRVHFADTEQAPYPFDILSEESFVWLKQQIFEIKPVLVVIDTLRELHAGDENDSQQMKNVISALVAATRPSALCLVSHSRKDNMSLPEGQRESLMNDNRGSGYVAGRMDTIMRVSKKTLTYQGRTIEEKRLKIKRTNLGLWEIDNAELEHMIQSVVQDRSMTSLLQRAERLAELTGRTVGSCRGLLRRRAEA
jgi:RecA-family ATPase